MKFRDSAGTKSRAEEMRSKVMQQVPLILKALKEDNRLARFDHARLEGKLDDLSKSMGLPNRITLAQLPQFIRHTSSESHIRDAHKIVEGYQRGIDAIRKL